MTKSQRQGPERILLKGVELSSIQSGLRSPNRTLAGSRKHWNSVSPTTTQHLHICPIV
jgi:hypothetical protein